MSDIRSFDVDIDVQSTTPKEKYGIRGMVYNRDTQRIRPHPSGFYHLTDPIPVDPITGNAAIDYEEAEEMGFYKIDLLSNSVYDSFSSRQEVLDAIDIEPDWDKLLDEHFVSKLPHIANHFDIVKKIQPRSVIELADVLALIRPGKSHLLEDYLRNRKQARRNLYKETAEWNKGMYFKKSHAVGYAVMIVCYMNKITNKTVF